MWLEPYDVFIFLQREIIFILAGTMNTEILDLFNKIRDWNYETDIIGCWTSVPETQAFFLHTLIWVVAGCSANPMPIGLSGSMFPPYFPLDMHICWTICSAF